MTLSEFTETSLNLWSDGGSLMLPLLFIAIFMYWNIFQLFSKFSQIEVQKKELFHLVEVEEVIHDKQKIDGHLRFIKLEFLPYFDTKIKFISVLVGVSPLLGLLGTVMGMLGTFSIMNRGDVKKVDLMAGGISEALITTQMGLIIAVPALLMIVSLKIKEDALRAYFEKIEIHGFKQFYKQRDMDR